jgi:hypothetical protein
MGTETWERLVDRLRKAVLAATTVAEFEAARQAVRRSLTPQQADKTDLADVCAAKFRELTAEQS